MSLEVDTTAGESEVIDSPDWVDVPEDMQTQTPIQNRYCFWYMKRTSAANKAVSMT